MSLDLIISRPAGEETQNGTDKSDITAEQPCGDPIKGA